MPRYGWWFLGVMLFVIFFALFSTLSSDVPSQNRSPPPPTVPRSEQKIQQYSYKVIQKFPHNPSYFTQGFEIVDGFLYEGTGLNGHSKLMKLDIFGSKSGKEMKVLNSVDLGQEFFGEGITFFKNKIYQLTWTSHVGFIYDAVSFEKLGQWNYPYQGWGLTHDDQNLIVSDGTNIIHFLDPDTQKELRTIEVKFPNGKKANNLNELEYIDGLIWANIWMTWDVVMIDPSNGQMVGIINFKNFHPPGDHDDVMNGIAHYEGRIFVTGKKWGTIYEVTVSPIEKSKRF